MAAAQDREEQLRMALERVHLVLLTMSTPEDIHEVLKVLYEEVRFLLPVVNACSIQVVDVEGKITMSYQISERNVLDWPMKDFAGSAVGEAWREQRVVYRPDLAVDDPYDEAWSLRTDDLYGLRVRAVVDVPFRQGTLAVNSTRPNAFTAEDLDILRAMARLLERGWDMMAHPERVRERAELVKDNVLLREEITLLIVFHDIAHLMLTSPDLDRALDIMVEHTTRAGIFRRLLVARVDAQARMVNVVRYADRLIRDHPIIGYACSLDDRHMLADVARTGGMRVLVGQDGRLDWWPGRSEENESRVSYCLPIQRGERVVMVVVTDSTIDEQDEMVHKLRRLQSLLSQVLINIEYAQLYAEAQTRAHELTRINEALQREIAERRRSEEARIAAEQELEEQRVLRMRSDRLRSLGQLATGMAHELSQPLAGIQNIAEYLLVGRKRRWDMSDGKVRTKLDLIVDQVDRMTHLINHVRMFAKEAGKPDVYSVQVNGVVQAAAGLLGTQFRSRGVELECELLEPLPLVLANPFSLEEVVLNLLINARDAVEERLHECSDDTCSRILLRTSVDREGAEDWVKIEIIDRGIGIPGQLLPRVFDPFFTTKGPDGGTGLGLSISLSIVEQCGGTIRLRSTPGCGTTATVILPVGASHGER